MEEHMSIFNNSDSDLELVNGSAVVSPTEELENLIRNKLGEKRRDIVSVICLIIVYSIIFITGVIGNFSTCFVIWKNPYMHTVTNFYLFNLAVSDVLTLMLALPPEVYSIWEAYPWRFGEPFCILKSFIMEMTSYSSVLTITGFTIEKYIAICHPIRNQQCCSISRAAQVIVLIWTISILSALPYPIHTRVFYYVTNTKTGQPISESLVCSIPRLWLARMFTVFQMSAFLYFVAPMIVITLFYVMIGFRLRQTELSNSCSCPKYGKATATRARRAVLRMLVAVVVAFFLCWAPFHAQRLMTMYVKTWTTELLEIHIHLFYVSGVLYFFSSTVNPILYNLLSRKFRRAFKRTLCRCCWNINSMPTFYKLKAIFINNDQAAQTSMDSKPSFHNNHFNYQEKNAMRLVTFYRKEKPSKCSCDEGPMEQASTKDTLMNKTSKSSSCTSHAHSDGGLHYLCRHKRCLNRRQTQLPLRHNCPVASYQDIDSLRRKQTDTARATTSFIEDEKKTVLKVTLNM